MAALPVLETTPTATGTFAFPVLDTDPTDVATLSFPVVSTTPSDQGTLLLPGIASPFTYFTLVPVGGVVVGGAPYIVNDPWLVFGGVRVGGGATVSAVLVSVSDWPVYGGVRVGGTSPDAFSWIEFVPSGGVRIGGAAGIPTTHTITVSGGVRVGGYAPDSTPLVWAPTGGVRSGGTAAVSFPTTLEVVPSGGVRAAGSAGVAEVSVAAVSGGVRLAGAASISEYFPVWTVSGGVVAGGTAFSYFLPADFTATDSNPYNDPFVAWVMNTETSAVSVYQGLPVTSMCTFRGVTYGTTRAGIYRRGGTTDDGAPVHSAIVLPTTDLELDRDKRIRAVYLGGRSSGSLLLRVGTKGSSRRYYQFTDSTSTTQGARAQLGRGLQARYWQFGIESLDGSTMEVDRVTYTPEILKRRGV